MRRKVSLVPFPTRVPARTIAQMKLWLFPPRTTRLVRTFQRHCISLPIPPAPLSHPSASRLPPVARARAPIGSSSSPHPSYSLLHVREIYLYVCARIGERVLRPPRDARAVVSRGIPAAHLRRRKRAGAYVGSLGWFAVRVVCRRDVNGAITRVSAITRQGGAFASFAPNDVTARGISSERNAPFIRSRRFAPVRSRSDARGCDA